MSREDMLAFIRDKLEDAPDRDVEAVYWMIMVELEGCIRSTGSSKYVRWICWRNIRSIKW